MMMNNTKKLKTTWISRAAQITCVLTGAAALLIGLSAPAMAQNVPSFTPSASVSQVPTQRTARTPAQRVSQTPAQRTAQTPAQRVSQTPAQRVSQTPAQRTAQTPDSRVSTTPRRAQLVRQTTDVRQSPTTPNSADGASNEDASSSRVVADQRGETGQRPQDNTNSNQTTRRLTVRQRALLTAQGRLPAGQTRATVRDGEPRDDGVTRVVEPDSPSRRGQTFSADEASVDISDVALTP